MQGLASIVGQARAVARLRAAMQSGKAHHAYLFEGPEGVGKRTTALALAAAWNCERAPGEGCGACGPCEKIAAGTHPDLIQFPVFDEEGKVAKQAERVRELIAQVGFPPHEGRARLVLVDPAHELNATAANILLKTLEEPPPGTHFVLITTAASRLLTTIRSRCQRVLFVPMTEAEITDQLVRNHGVDGAAAAQAAALAGGSIGRALQLAKSEELPERMKRVERMIAAAHGGRAQAMLDAAAELSGERDEAMATLELLWVTYHDAIVIAEGPGTNTNAGAGAGGKAEARKLAGRVPTASLLRAAGAIEEATGAVRGYVAPQLALERMLLRIAQVGGA